MRPLLQRNRGGWDVVLGNAKQERTLVLSPHPLLYFRETNFILLIQVIQVQGENTGKQKSQKRK